MTTTIDLPYSTVRLGFSRAGLELKMFWRDSSAVLSTLGMPVILLLILGAVFNSKIGDTGVDFRQYLAVGMIGSGIMSTTFISLGTAIVNERDDGTLKRLYGTPMPKAAYLIGKVLAAISLSFVETVIIVVVAISLFGVGLPSTPGRWLTFVWVFILGVATCTILGIALSSVPRSSRSAAAVFSIPLLILQFVSGVFWVFAALPGPLQQIGALFPLKWITQGLRSAFLPDTLLSAEVTNSWQHGLTALVLAAWLVGSVVLALTTFRWQRDKA